MLRIFRPPREVEVAAPETLMKSLFCALTGALGLCFAASGLSAAAPPASAVYVTTFVEVLPGAAEQAAGFLREYRVASRREPGLLEGDVYEESGTPSRFVTNEVWQDMAAYNAHNGGSARSALWERLKPIEFGPPDARTHFAHFISEKTATPPANSVFILSHLDVTPPQLPALLELMTPLAEGSAKEPGSEIYEIVRQGQTPGMGNHFRLFEVWTTEKAWEDHNLAPHTQTFRNKLAPLLGTPYDQRKYTRLN
jgi:quinol monooxygenase YgiN